MNARENLQYMIRKITGSYKAVDPFTTREEWERRLTRKLNGHFKDSLDHLLELLGDPPNPNNIPESYWQNGGKQLRVIFEVTLTAIALDRAVQYLVVAPIGGVDWTLVNQAAVDWARRYSYELVKDIEQTTRAALQKEISNFFVDGEMTIDDLAQRLQYYYSPVRSEMIAITETTRAAVEGEREIVREIEKYGIQMQPVWQTANDDIVCEICGPKHGKPITDGEFPPAHPRCVLPENIIGVFGDIQAAAKSYYEGSCVEITSGNGRRITVTNNHPILTRRGWITANEINERDYLFSTSDNIERMSSAINPNYQHGQSAIEDIFSSLSMSSGMFSRSVPISTEYFNGDGKFIKGDVNIIYSNRFLLSDGIPVGNNPVSKDGFNFGYMQSLPLNSNGSFNHLLGSSRSSFSGSMSIPIHSNPLFRSGFTPTNIHTIGNITRSDTKFNYPLPESPSIDTSLARQFLLRFSSNISLDKVIKVRNFYFSGHVYDLQSDLYELYTCNGIITHNCRCWVNHEIVRDNGDN